jgi:hypothetical protein
MEQKQNMTCARIFGEFTPGKGQPRRGRREGSATNYAEESPSALRLVSPEVAHDASPGSIVARSVALQSLLSGPSSCKSSSQAYR